MEVMQAREERNTKRRETQVAKLAARDEVRIGRAIVRLYAYLHEQKGYTVKIWLSDESLDRLKADHSSMSSDEIENELKEMVYAFFVASGIVNASRLKDPAERRRICETVYSTVMNSHAVERTTKRSKVELELSTQVQAQLTREQMLKKRSKRTDKAA
jgi:hypothetical protein